MRWVVLITSIKVLECLRQNRPNDIVREQSQYFILSYQTCKIDDFGSIFKVSPWSIERWFGSWAEIGTHYLEISGDRAVKLI